MEGGSAGTGIETTSDGDLVARCRRGDEEAWGALVDRFSRYVYAITGPGFRLSEADSDDVFQEVFARTFEHLGRLRDDEAIRPWIAQLTRRLAIDRVRNDARLVPSEGLEAGAAGADDVFARLDQAIEVRAALGRLSADSREVLGRFFVLDQSYRTIGDALGIPSGTIASRISRALAKLRVALEETQDLTEGHALITGSSRN